MGADLPVKYLRPGSALNNIMKPYNVAPLNWNQFAGPIHKEESDMQCYQYLAAVTAVANELEAFPEIKHNSLLIKPQELLTPMIKSIIGGGKLGIIIPDESQVDQIYKWWNMTEGLTVKFASPYENPENLKKAAEELKDEEVDIIYMDCMGYTREMRTIVENISGKTTVLPRTLAIGIINNL